jgi:flavin reductase (DIM6/NTAB) family NADH-FMN oxidoreductase RutF
MFKTIVLKDIGVMQVQTYLQHVIAPRPICFASTIDKSGNINLAPFSFFNVFSSNPPIVIFSPARRGRDNTTKHTLQNVLEVPEVNISVVTYSMVQQTSLASCEYEKGIDEFVKAGFTKTQSKFIKPPGIAESPVNMECKVIEVKPLGTEGGAGNLVICEVLAIHLDEAILNATNMPDQTKLDLVARLGGNYYSRANAKNTFEVEKPNTQLGMGVDALPEAIRNSKILTGNNLGQLANVSEQPVIDAAFNSDKLKQIVQYYSINPIEMEQELHRYAKDLLDNAQVAAAWQVLLALP